MITCRDHFFSFNPIVNRLEHCNLKRIRDRVFMRSLTRVLHDRDIVRVLRNVMWPIFENNDVEAFKKMEEIIAREVILTFLYEAVRRFLRHRYGLNEYYDIITHIVETYPEIVHYKWKRDETILFFLCIPPHTQSPRLMKSLLDNGARLDVQDSGGCTPIHRALIYNNLTFLSDLAKCGVTIDHKECMELTRSPTVEAATRDFVLKNLCSPKKR